MGIASLLTDNFLVIHRFPTSRRGVVGNTPSPLSGGEHPCGAGDLGSNPSTGFFFLPFFPLLLVEVLEFYVVDFLFGKYHLSHVSDRDYM